MQMRILFPPLRLLAVFEAVARSGSTQRAASELNVTQPAVSQAIKLLEEHIGARLFDRSTRPATLTPAGQILHRAVGESFGRIEEAIGSIQLLRSDDDRSLTLACTVGTATYWLMPRLAGFYAAHPDIAVNVLTTAGIPEVSPGVDLVIRYGLGDWTDGHTVRLFYETVVPVCSPAIADRMLAENGLATATLLHVVNADSSWLTWKDYFEVTGLAVNRAPGRNFTNYVQATQAALSGQGVMLGWESNTGDLVREGRLVKLPGADYHPREAFYLVVPARSERKVACQLFSAWIKALIEGTDG